MMDPNKMKVVYTLTERGDKSYWTRIGVAYVNRDGSLNLKLDAMPTNGTMHVRDWTARDEQQPAEQRSRRGNGAPAPEPMDELPEAFS